MKEVYEQYKDIGPKLAFQYCQCVIYNWKGLTFPWRYPAWFVERNGI